MARIVLQHNDLEMRKLDDFKYASKEKQRFLVYAHFIGTSERIIKYETDEKLCYFTEILTPKIGTNGGYLQRQTTEGFTIDKTKNKKLSVWFGKKLIKVSSKLIDTMMRDTGNDWYADLNNNLRLVATRMLFEKIIKGNITSSIQYVASYVKYHLKVKGVDPIRYQAAIVLNSVSIGDLNAMLRYASNPDDILMNYSTYMHNSRNRSIITCCQILGRTFDWSSDPTVIKAQLDSMGKEIEKLNKEYKVVQEFYGYIR
jgi:hypothetical protein